MLYSEKQSLKYTTKWYLISAYIFMKIFSILFVLFLKVDTIDTIGLVVLCIVPFVLMAIFLFISAVELNIKIDTNEIGYQLTPLFNKWAYISKKNVVSYQVTGRTSRIINPKNKIIWFEKSKRFIISGRQYLELELTDNRKLTFSTLYPKKIEKAMLQLMNNK